MKIRTGFVSNSSSSSFIVMVKKGMSELEMRARVAQYVGPMSNFFMPDFRQNLIDTIMECKGDKVDLKKDLAWEQKWKDEHPDPDDHDTDEIDRLQKLIDKNVDYYEGGFSDNGDGALQYWLCETSFKIEGDGFSMINEAGY